MEIARKKVSKRAIKEGLIGYLFASPFLIGFFGLTFGPMIFSFILSLGKWNAHNPLSDYQFLGFGNFQEILVDDTLFRTALFNTSYYAFFSVPLGITFALFLALLLNQKLKGIYIYRTIFYIPSLVAGVATIILWKWIFNPDFGILNSFLKLLGMQGPAWLQSPVWAKPALIIMSLWGVGGTMLIFLAGLQNIPHHLYEVADLDGASRWHRFRHVTIPMLTPTIYFNLIMSIIGCFQIFTAVYIMAPTGGAKNSLLFYVLYLYRKAFMEFEMGYASALAWMLFIIILALTLLVIKSSAIWVYYEGERK
ncbi:sugar ABC transporter permease [candidate division KSB1 bacterium]|nr:sugar ABC transporter permease [candidate division KSB1 bacterium]